MRTLAVAALGAVTGIVVGLVSSEVIGILGYVLTHRPVGVRYLPLYLAALFAVLAPVLAGLLRRRR